MYKPQFWRNSLGFILILREKKSFSDYIIPHKFYTFLTRFGLVPMIISFVFLKTFTRLYPKCFGSTRLILVLSRSTFCFLVRSIRSRILNNQERSMGRSVVVLITFLSRWRLIIQRARVSERNRVRARKPIFVIGSYRCTWFSLHARIFSCLHILTSAWLTLGFKMSNSSNFR